MSLIRAMNQVLRLASRRAAATTTTAVPAISTISNPFQITSKNAHIRALHASRPQENMIVVGSIGVAGVALGGKYLLEAYTAYQANKSSGASSSASTASSSSGIFNMNYRNFYDGPFEDQMTRREAALILGVRESASPDRIRNAHRKLLIANHPDTGGSTFISTKINEAKELLLGGK